jgi:hypothetical protein
MVYKPGFKTALHSSSLLLSGGDMASAGLTGLWLELKKAPKKGIVGAARRAFVLVFEWGGLRVEDKNREKPNVGAGRRGMVWCLRGERRLRDSWDRIETESIEE